VLLLLASHLVVIGGGEEEELGKTKRKRKIFSLVCGSFLAVAR
jgi:hypothetical protein